VVALLAAVGVGAWVLLRPSHAGKQDEAADAVQVAAALDRLATEPASLVAAAQAGPEAAVAARSAVPGGTVVTSDLAIWQPDDLGGGLMEVRLEPPGAEPVTYLTIAVREESGWKVLDTVPVEAPPPWSRRHESSPAHPWASHSSDVLVIDARPLLQAVVAEAAPLPDANHPSQHKAEDQSQNHPADHQPRPPRHDSPSHIPRRLW
jgi:hypothetical protein